MNHISHLPPHHNINTFQEQISIDVSFSFLASHNLWIYVIFHILMQACVWMFLFIKFCIHEKLKISKSW
jgi:hypothetical protein